MFRQAMLKPPVAFSGGDTQGPAGSTQIIEQRGNPVIQRLNQLTGLARRAKGASIGLVDPAPQFLARAGQQQPDRLRQAEADNPANLMAIGQRLTAGGKGRVHRVADAGLAIDQRAIAIEYRQFHAHGTSVRISWAIAGEPAASSPAITRARSSGDLFWLSFSVGRHA